ncbi:MAG: AGE family epimerase/isomerase [Hyphomicrobiales bacterium]|nr:AGE family epimerase/isomerase [Hyphomicrobiales bacterium]
MTSQTLLETVSFQVTDDPYDRARDWLFNKALPFWAIHGVDREHGGFIEQLRPDGSSAELDFKRTRVLCRQIYVFSHAALLGWEPGAALARHGYDFLVAKAWLGPEAGWARRLDLHGRVKDPTPDLYDLSFVLFALGWFYRLTRDDEVLNWALRTENFIDRHMRPTKGMGFLHEKPAIGPKIQNPHMHLLEAMWVNLETSGHPKFRAIGDEIIELFTSKLFDKTTKTLAEYFDEDWVRLGDERGRMVEPGHHFEWAWLLAGYQRLTGCNLSEYVHSLADFAETFGVNKSTGVVFNLVRDDGKVLDAATRVWPNAERIQAAAALFEQMGKDPHAVFSQTTTLLFNTFLNSSPEGTWIERYTADGRPLANEIPASTLYHIFIAFSEMLRIESKVKTIFKV